MGKGYALDVVIVTPDKSRTVDANNNGHNAVTSSDEPATSTAAAATAVTSCSDFAVYFSSGKRSSIDAAAEMAHSLAPSSSSFYASSSKKKLVVITVMINGKPIPRLEMFLKTDGTCRFREGESFKPSTTILEQLVEDETISPGRNLLEYVYDRHPESSGKPKTEGGDDVVVNESSQLKNGSISTTAKQPSNKNIVMASAYLYRWSVRDSIIVSDIDGTVTKSDFSGIRDTVLTEKFNNGHRGICKFYSQLSQIRFPRETDRTTSSVQFMYLTSRPITLISKTRKFLSSLVQKDDGCDGRYMLPPGPIFAQRTSSLSSVVFNEVVAKKSHEYKADVLSRQIVIPFAAAGRRQSKNDALIISCFGNNKGDARAYEMAGIRQDDIYIVNKHSQIVCMGDVDTSKGKTQQQELCCPPSMHDQSSATYDSYDDPLLDRSIREKLELRFGRFREENKPS